MSTQSALTFVLTMFFAILTLSIVRLLWILPMIRTQHRSPAKPSAKVVIVLGSGGHTAEMLRLIEPLDFDKYTSRIYVVSSGDTLSEGKARDFELGKQGIGDKKFYDIITVPRARRVGQTWLTTPFSVLQCLLGSIRAVLVNPLPDAVICNGPGTCVLICLAALIPRFFGVKHIHIVYVESFARVTALSLSGKILLYLSDRFFVQWPELARKYPRAECLGILV